jgi:hypothetical protein
VTDDFPDFPQSGWQFANLFYDHGKRLFYCRLRRITTAAPITKWPEVTGAGATMQIAMANAIDLAEGVEHLSD